MPDIEYLVDTLFFLPVSSRSSKGPKSNFVVVGVVGVPVVAVPVLMTLPQIFQC